jgi:hypothetical protein
MSLKPATRNISWVKLEAFVDWRVYGPPSRILVGNNEVMQIVVETDGAEGLDDDNGDAIYLPWHYHDAWCTLYYNAIHWRETFRWWETNAPDANCLPRITKLALWHNMALNSVLDRVYPLTAHELNPQTRIAVFDEYIIKERFDLFFLDPKKYSKDQKDLLRLDPFDVNNRDIFGK